MGHEQAALQLPITVTSRTDLGRLQRELNDLDDFISQAAIRKTGISMQLPKTTRQLDEVAKSNKLNLLQPEDRKVLAGFLAKVYKEAPIIHISFATDPQPAFLQKITAWFRQEIHPQAFLHVGLQPNIAAGCTVRTQNRYFDLSLRKDFYKQSSELIENLKAETGV